MGSGAFAQDTAPPELQPKAFLEAEKSPHAAREILVKATKAGSSLVAVGERGHIIRSTDKGNTWHQADHVPTQSTLTDVHFLDPKTGWAVGHDAIILYTDDAGRTWTRQHADPGGESLLLTIHFFNHAHGFAMGDGSLILETKDGGASWKRHTAWRHTYGDFQLSDAFQSPKADTIYVAADFGALFRFKDTGPTFRLVQTPAQSTFRRGFMLDDGTVWLAGAKDRLWRSNRRRTNWRSIKTNAEVNLNTGAALEDGTLVFAGDQGTVLVSHDKGDTFSRVHTDQLGDYVDVLPIAERKILLLGSQGLTLAMLPSAQRCPPDRNYMVTCRLTLLETRFKARPKS